MASKRRAMRSCSASRSAGTNANAFSANGKLLRVPPCKAESGLPVRRHTSSARWMRCVSPGAMRRALFGSTRSSSACSAGHPRSAALGFAVPTSSPRYTCAESIDTSSTGARSASAMARRDFPLAVGPSSATDLPATRDVEYCSGHVGRLVGGEPQDRPRDLLRLARAAKRRRGADLVRAARIAARSVDLRADHARSHRVHADIFAADLLREAERQGIDRAFRRGIVDVHGGRAQARRDRREVDGRAAVAAVARRHALHRLACAEEAARDVDGEHALEARHAHLIDARRAIDDPRVVREHREPAQAPIHLGEQAHDVGFHRDVGGDGEAADFARERLARAAIAHVIDAYLVAAPGGEPRRRGADAAAGARNEHHAAHQRPRRKSLSRSAIVSWYQVGRPWLQLPERSVASISRKSAFISVVLSARCARTAAWQAMVARSSFCRPASIWLAPYSRISLSRPRARPTTSPLARSTGALRTVSSFGPDTTISSPTRSRSSWFSSAVATSSASAESTAGTSKRWRATSPASSARFRRSMTMRSCAACMSTSTRPASFCARM